MRKTFENLNLNTYRSIIVVIQRILQFTDTLRGRGGGGEGGVVLDWKFPGIQTRSFNLTEMAPSVP